MRLKVKEKNTFKVSERQTVGPDLDTLIVFLLKTKQNTLRVKSADDKKKHEKLPLWQYDTLFHNGDFLSSAVNSLGPDQDDITVRHSDTC